MKIKVGTVISSDFGTGPVVAITKEWLIHIGGGGLEFALGRDDEYWIPKNEDDHEIGGGQELEIEHPQE